MVKSTNRSNSKQDKNTKNTAKPPRQTVKKLSKERLKNMTFLERCRYRRAFRADKRARQHAEMLATLPKNPVKRFFAHFNPKRVFHYWFSSYGFHQFCKIFLGCILVGIIAVGGLFIYYKKDLEDIQLSNISIEDTVNTYLDRNGVVLWEDVGSDDYRLVVEGSEISTYMRQATVAIEDKNFYNHPGVDLKGLIRAAVSTLTGQGVQGGSTLTQQLIKQVYFSEEAASSNRGGIARKIKEFILAIELEKMYDKEQIITMYLNESPYGGRRNGVESAAQTYFDKSAAELDLAESALLAAIPNNPAVLDPYNEDGNEALIARQQKTLDAMAQLGYITTEEAEEAKAVNILDRIQPESAQYTNMKAPHFVLEVKEQLEEKYGYSVMHAGGLTITTTLDYRLQEIAEDAVAAGAELLSTNGSDNIALASVDVETGQVVAMVGSVDFYNSDYGEVNATTSTLEPGSSIKPVLDYAPLFMQRDGQNYGPGSIIPDTNFDSVYCAGYTGSCALRNYTGKFYGNITIRKALAGSLNIPAAKALYINGISNSLEIAHALGDVSYCADGESAGLSMAIGSGCTVRPVEHANAYASLARGGVYKELSYVLSITNSDGDTLESWTDSAGTQVIDPQVAWLIGSILSDSSARSFVFGTQSTSFGFVVPGVWTATKTGTSTTADSSVAKDSWILNYSTVLATAVWNGNHDGSGLSNSSNTVVRRVTNDYMERAHKEVYAADGRWTSGDEPVMPSGIQRLTVGGVTDYWPSWFDAKKNSGTTSVTLEFNKYTGNLASTCTIDSYKISIEGTKTVDPITKQETYSFPDGYNKDILDDCSYVYSSPKVSLSVSRLGTITISATKGEGSLKTYELYFDSKMVESGDINSTTFVAQNYYSSEEDVSTIRVVIYDEYGGTAEDSVSL